MTTRRRIICSILSALLITSSCSVFGPDTPQRVVRVHALADVPFRTRNPRWADEVRGLVEAASDYYDLIVAFTAEGVSRYLAAGRPRVDRIGNCTQGLANYVVAPVTRVFHYRGPHAEPEADVITLIHELGHILGAEHVDDTRSIMHEDFGYRTEFDAKNRAIIQKNRSCAFAK